VPCSLFLSTIKGFFFTIFFFFPSSQFAICHTQRCCHLLSLLYAYSFSTRSVAVAVIVYADYIDSLMTPPSYYLTDIYLGRGISEALGSHGGCQLRQLKLVLRSTRCRGQVFRCLDLYLSADTGLGTQILRSVFGNNYNSQSFRPPFSSRVRERS